VTVSEFGFLAMGLLLGMAGGVALIETFRARPAARGEVRVTVAQDAIPRRRAATLADDAFVGTPAEPARGGPADRREGDGGSVPGGVERRTSVRFDAPDRPPAELPMRTVAGGGVVLTPPTGRSMPDPRPSASLVAVPVSGGEDPVMAGLRATAAATALAGLRTGASTSVAVMDRPESASGPEAQPGSAGATAATGTPIPAGPCADLRRLADERCAVATGARVQATAAEDTLRQAQRAYDDHEARAEVAAKAADPRAVRAAKDAAQTTFRHDRSGSRTTEAVEAAARAWLLEINRINAEARDASAAVTHEREAARLLTLELEHLAVAADAARIAAETADAACLTARQVAADCDEQDAADRLADPPPSPFGGPDTPFVEEPSPLGSLAGGRTPRVFRLLRGDRAAMTELVNAMGGDDPEERRRWQLVLSDLVDAIVADSIAASALSFPTDHPFWGPFTLGQDRDIAGALSSLGYRFDGLGGWVDGRIPSQRDLSLAVGYAGLDPMRIRHWPDEREMSALFSDVTVAADEHLAGAAGDLTLGELVSMLGRRADGLAEVWNQWGRLRPLLLEER
jgi:hypothetical protein